MREKKNWNRVTAMSKILKVPYIKQTVPGGWYDFKRKKFIHTSWPNQILKGGRRIRTSGCGPCSVAMALSYLLDKKINPATLKTKYVARQGSTHDIGAYEAAKVGIKTKYTNDIDEIIRAVKKGCPVMSIQGKGLFTKHGHYILIIGVTDTGRLCINDPASSKRTYRLSGKTYSKREVDSTTKKSDGRGYTIFYPNKKPYDGRFPTGTIRRGDHRADVRNWQSFLKWYGYTAIKVDGGFGAETEKYTRSFQKDRGLVPDGVVGSRTIREARSVRK